MSAGATPTTELTGAALLREAARVMREQAEAVSYTGPWHVADLGTHGHEGVLWVETDGAKSGQYATVVEFDNMPGQKAFAAHIASWHPTVALAVADWLGEQADAWDLTFGSTQLPSRGVDQPPAVHFGDPEAARLDADYHARRALAVARAYLGLS